MKKTNFSEDIKRGTRGEFASVVAMAANMPGIENIEFKKTENPSCPDDFTLLARDGSKFSIDMKTDWHTMKTSNLFFEPASQIRLNDESIFPSCEISNLFTYKISSAQDSAKKVCDCIINRINNKEELGIPKNRQGWGIKDLGHVVGYWAIKASSKSFSGKEHIIHKYIDKLEMSEAFIQKPDLLSLKDMHDDFMKEMGISSYLLYLLDKKMLLDLVKKNHHLYKARCSFNQNYVTLGYLVPLSEINNLVSESPKQAKRYAWRV